MSRVAQGRIIRSPVTDRRYRIGPVIGSGGYGKAYQAFDLTNQAEVCLKYTYDQLSWHREAYFGELFRRHRRVIQIYDSFPVMPKSGRGRIRYCLVLELAPFGAVADYLERTGEGWPEDRARREIMALLRVLDQLHGGSATHRDITPFNIFVCKAGVLKLGDFGIARHELAGRPHKPEAFNPDYVTRGIIDAEHRAWEAVDDVFQMGQLLTMLVLGKAKKVSLAQLRRSRRISPEMKVIIKRAIGPRSRRYPDADARAYDRGDPIPPPSRLESLRGKRVVFSGPLSIPRLDAEVLAAGAGAIVHRRTTRTVDVLVQGRRRGEGVRSVKLMEVERLIRQGRRVDIIGEAEFRRLVRA